MPDTRAVGQCCPAGWASGRCLGRCRMRRPWQAVRWQVALITRRSAPSLGVLSRRRGHPQTAFSVVRSLGGVGLQCRPRMRSARWAPSGGSESKTFGIPRGRASPPPWRRGWTSLRCTHSHMRRSSCWVDKARLGASPLAQDDLGAARFAGGPRVRVDACVRRGHGGGSRCGPGPHSCRGHPGSPMGAHADMQGDRQRRLVNTSGGILGSLIQQSRGSVVARRCLGGRRLWAMFASI